MFEDTLRICLKEYSKLYGNGNVDFYRMIIKYEKTKTGLNNLLKTIGAGKGKGFAIARTMDIDKFCEYMENPRNEFISRIKAGDMSLVSELSKFGSRKGSHCFSAATKICTLWRESLEFNGDCEVARPAPFVIADSFVRDALANINRTDGFTSADIKKVYEHRQYENWHRIILDFKKHFRLDSFSERDVDKSLWVLWNKFLTRPLMDFAQSM